MTGTAMFFGTEELRTILAALEGWRSIIDDQPTTREDYLIDTITEYLRK